MNLHERMRNALNGIEDPTKRAIAFLSEFGSMLQERGAKIPIVVGGAALEIYTSGQYSFHDIDIKSHLSITMDILGQIGFENEGRSLMYSEEFDILLDWQGSSLEEGPEAEERILKIRAVRPRTHSLFNLKLASSLAYRLTPMRLSLCPAIFGRHLLVK